jgi:putative PIN family toxin of toxin-antitoxin system
VRIVADANVLISAIITPSGSPGQLLDRWREGQIILLISDPILAEYQRALRYSHIRRLHGLSDEGIGNLIDRLRRFGVLINPTHHLSIIAADPSDDKYLECAVAGEADYIVSGDVHLLALRRYVSIPILSPRTSLAVLDEGLG